MDQDQAGEKQPVQRTKSYTRVGDAGTTSLRGGDLVSKSDLRVSAYGTLDELNAWLGHVRSLHSLDKDIDNSLSQMQNNLLTIGALLAMPKQTNVGRNVSFAAPAAIAELEAQIDAINDHLPQLTQFVVPGGTKTASLLHVARTVARRAERLVVALAEQDEIDKGFIAYLNRISSALFVYSRHVNFKSGVKEQTW